MSKPRMIQRQFGSVSFTTGTVPPGTLNQPGTHAVVFNEIGNGYQTVRRHNDKFYIPDKVTAPTEPLGGLLKQHFATYDYVDLRDLMENQHCMDDVTINVQRLKELPYPNVTYNMPPGNIEETLLVILGDLNLESLDTSSLQNWHDAGFKPMLKDAGGLPFEVLYRENRQYIQDPSQNFISPNMIGTQAGPTGDPTVPTRFVSNYRLQSRTIGGYPDLIVGPGLTIVRVWSIWPADRTVQNLNGGGAGTPPDAPALELTGQQMQLMVDAPALQINIVGTERPLTATETATYYSNILLNQG